MADATEYCVVEVAGAWTDNENAWDVEDDPDVPVTAAYTSTDQATTSGRVKADSPFSAIPSGATITGIVLQIYGYRGDSDDLVKGALYHTTDAEYTSLASGTAPLSPAWFDIGIYNSLWGKTWSADDDIKVSTFGAQVLYDQIAKAAGSYIYAVRIKVYYTPAATTQTFYKTLDGRVKKVQEFTKNLGATVFRTMDFSKTLDARVKVTNEFTKTLDAMVVAVKEFVKTLDAVIFGTQTFNKTLDAQILKMTAFTKTLDATVKAEQSFTKTLNATIAGGTPPPVTVTEEGSWWWR
jgi:hypothetical protein